MSGTQPWLPASRKTPGRCYDRILPHRTFRLISLGLCSISFHCLGPAAKPIRKQFLILMLRCNGSYLHQHAQISYLVLYFPARGIVHAKGIHHFTWFDCVVCSSQWALRFHRHGFHFTTTYRFAFKTSSCLGKHHSTLLVGVCRAAAKLYNFT